VVKHSKIAILKQLPPRFKAKCEKDVGTPFPRVPAHCTPVHIVEKNMQTNK